MSWTPRQVPDLDIHPHDTYGRLRSYAAALGVTVYSGDLPTRTHGLYDSVTRTVKIDRHATYRIKRCALVHELVHDLHRDRCDGTCLDARLERRARRETARLLVDDDEYRTAEMMYDGDLCAMSMELDVTRQVIGDYRSLVLEALVTSRRASPI